MIKDKEVSITIVKKFIQTEIQAVKAQFSSLLNNSNSQHQWSNYTLVSLYYSPYSVLYVDSEEGNRVRSDRPRTFGNR
ncbi:MAG: hypothetical protein ACRCTJ_01585 [Brevinema sp.]